tara:strand:+ start:3859 stop:4173 length:315 start_codon:yes stop_codon:yes gene_type:complete
MKKTKLTIIYLEFLDHSSLTNLWQTYEEFEKDCEIEPCWAVGFLEKEDSVAYYISTMKSSKELGSGHTVLKSACTYVKKIPQKPVFKGIEYIKSRILVENPLIL